MEDLSRWHKEHFANPFEAIRAPPIRITRACVGRPGRETEIDPEVVLVVLDLVDRFIHIEANDLRFPHRRTKFGANGRACPHRMIQAAFPRPRRNICPWSSPRIRLCASSMDGRFEFRLKHVRHSPLVPVLYALHVGLSARASLERSPDRFQGGLPNCGRSLTRGCPTETGREKRCDVTSSSRTIRELRSKRLSIS